jgi:NhaP-type Na+/H+ or K+/H+ antiporter
LTSDPYRIPRVGAAGFGAMLGFCNTLFVATGVGIAWHGGFALALIVFLFGIMPGLITGAVLGWLAARTAERDVWWRRLVLAGSAVAVLLGLAAFFGVTSVFVMAIIPTVVSAFILERNSRVVSSMPVATLKLPS